MDPGLAALATVALLLFVKEAGVPVPVPGDLLVIGAGVAAATGPQSPLVALAMIVVATIAGGLVQFALLRAAARPLALRLLGRLGITEQRMERMTRALRARGARGVAVARMTPGVRILTIPAAALAGLTAAPFAGGLAAGNSVFVGGHFALGFVVGEPIVRLAGSALGLLAALFVAAALIGFGGWLLLARRSGSRRTPTAAWADAACPACLVLAAASPAGPGT